MSRAWVVTLFWAGLLLIHWLVMWVVFNPDLLPAGLLFGAAAVTAVGGAYLWWQARRDRRRRGEVEFEAVPDLSQGTVAVGLALAAILLGFELGLWLILIGAGALLWGLFGIVAELRASRRAAGAAARSASTPGPAGGTAPEEAGSRGGAGPERSGPTATAGRPGGRRGASGSAGRSTA